MAYTPDNKKYLPYDWSGVVTANDLAIQNQPFSLGQHEGPTEAQRAQQEREQWFRDRGLDPNKYYGEEIEAQAPQPGFNPAGGKVNQSNRKTVSFEEQMRINPSLDPVALRAALDSSKNAEAQAKIWQKAEKQLPKQPPIDPKAAALRAEEWRAQQRAIGAPGTTAPTVTTANWWQPRSFAPTPNTPGMPPAGQPIDNGVINTPEPSAPAVPESPMTPIPGLQNTPRPAPGALPNYAQPNAGAGGSINDVLKQYQTGGMTLPMSPVGQPNVQPSPLPQLQQQGFTTPGSAPIGTPAQSFGNAAKLLQLPSYLRRGIGVGGIRRTY